MGEDSHTSCNVNILTLNCWGIPRVSKDRDVRMKAIAEEIACSKYDVVCLQEVWKNEDFELIKSIVFEVLPYSHYFYSGVIGSGICIFSRYEMTEALYHQWQLNGYIHKIFHADWFGGKGVGLCQLLVNGLRLNVYTTHLHAQYDCDNDEYEAHRLIQAFDLAQFIRLTAGSADLCVLAGDLNVETEDLCLQLILEYARLTDAMTKSGHACMSTYTCSRNSYTKRNSKLLDQGQRIDHILYRSGPRVKVELTSHDYSFQERIPGTDISYSDHEAINSVFRLTRRPPADVSKYLDHLDFYDQCSNLKALKVSLVKSIDVCNNALAHLRRDRVWYICVFVILSTFLAVISIFDPHLSFVWFLRSYNIVPVTITLILVFCSLMAFLWNSLEYNGVLCAKSTMKIALRRTQVYRREQRRTEQDRTGSRDELLSEEEEYTDDS
uniref:sphingomyelin phosphodiesterase n=1 Tax=Cacopsylla melanoneura TaxID=428564 RepID=A0A8D8WG82_9HEMI